MSTKAPKPTYAPSWPRRIAWCLLFGLVAQAMVAWGLCLWVPVRAGLECILEVSTGGFWLTPAYITTDNPEETCPIGEVERLITGLWPNGVSGGVGASRVRDWLMANASIGPGVELVEGRVEPRVGVLLGDDMRSFSMDERWYLRIGWPWHSMEARGFDNQVEGCWILPATMPRVLPRNSEGARVGAKSDAVLPYAPLLAGTTANTLAFAAVPLTVLVALRLRRLRSVGRGQCAQCGHRLFPDADGAHCSECGWTLDAAASARLARLSSRLRAAGFIAKLAALAAYTAVAVAWTLAAASDPYQGERRATIFRRDRSMDSPLVTRYDSIGVTAIYSTAGYDGENVPIESDWSLLPQWCDAQEIVGGMPEDPSPQFLRIETVSSTVIAFGLPWRCMSAQLRGNNLGVEGGIEISLRPDERHALPLQIIPLGFAADTLVAAAVLYLPLRAWTRWRAGKRKPS